MLAAAAVLVGGTSIFARYRTQIPLDGVLEVASFRLASGITGDAFHRSVPASNAFLQRQKGFVRRRIGRSSDGDWVDVVEWASMEDATRAGEKFPTEPSVAPFAATIDMSTLKLVHYSVQSRSR
ncbi:hypothetical protein [Sphingorhabdus sp.]|uniref:hypothetical protein n=1 Tax=Sphingorhabdus sp. TaxID=1902408 RepID=UPI0032B8187E